MKKPFLVLTLAVVCSLFGMNQLLAQEVFADYENSRFHGNMMGNIITADMTFLPDSRIEFKVNLPGEQKLHNYRYEIVDVVYKNGRVFQIEMDWFENEKLEKHVSVSGLSSDGFTMELKGKGKVLMRN